MLLPAEQAGEGGALDVNGLFATRMRRDGVLIFPNPLLQDIPLLLPLNHYVSLYECVVSD